MRKGVGDEAPPIDIMSSRCSSENSPRSSRCTVVDDISRGASQYEARVCLEVDLLSDHAELYAGIDRTIDRCVPEDFGDWKEIGHGNFATCYAVTALRDMKGCAEGTTVCLKVYKKQCELAVHRELTALYRLTDPEEENCAVQLVGYNLTQAPYFLVLSSAGDMTLDAEMKRRGGSLPRDLMLRIAGDVLSALEYAHSWGVIHRDVKAANVMVTTLGEDDTATDAPVARLIDWGESEDLMAHEENQGSALTSDLTKDVGTWRWMSPAVMSLPNARVVKMKATDVDMYSYGAVLYNMVTNRVPFDKLTDVQVVFCVTRAMRPSFKEVPDDSIAEQSTRDSGSDGAPDAAKPSALLEFLIRSCFDTDTPAPPYAVVREILQAVGKGLGEREEEHCDDGCELHELFWPPVAGDGVLLAALSKHTVGSYRALRATQEEGAAQEEGKRQYCDDRAKEVKPPRFRTLRRRLSEIFGPTENKTPTSPTAGDRPTAGDFTWRRMRRMSIDAHTIQMSSSRSNAEGNLDPGGSRDSGYSVASFRSGRSASRRLSVTSLSMGKRIMSTFTKPPRDITTTSGSTIGSSLGGSSIGGSMAGSSIGGSFGSVVGGSYGGQPAQQGLPPGPRRATFRRNSYAA